MNMTLKPAFGLSGSALKVIAMMFSRSLLVPGMIGNFDRHFSRRIGFACARWSEENLI